MVEVLFNLSKTLQLFPDITYKQIIKLEKVPKVPIVYENVDGRLSLKQFNQTKKSLLCMANTTIFWDKMEMK